MARSAFSAVILARTFALITLVVAARSLAAAQEPERFQPPAAPLPPSAERAYRAMLRRVDGFAALDTVRYMDQFWRLAGNPGFNASIDTIRARLTAAGYAAVAEKDLPFVRVEEWGQPRGWDYEIGTVSFADGGGGPGGGDVLLSRLRDRVSLCINSFSTPKGGVTAPLIDVGAGDAAAFERVDVKGAVVLGDADAGRLWQQAVKARGALGVQDRC